MIAVAIIFSSCDKKVSVESVSLSKATLSLKVGENATLEATVLPADAEDKSLAWTSSSNAVATVVNGKVTAIAKGSATITVTTNDGGKSATCAVTVTEGAVIPDTDNAASVTVSFGSENWTATLIEGMTKDGEYMILAGKGADFDIENEASYPFLRVRGPNSVGNCEYTYGGDYTFDYFENTFLTDQTGSIVYGDWDTMDGSVIISKIEDGKISGTGTATMRDEFDYYENGNTTNAELKTVSVTFKNIPLSAAVKIGNALSSSIKNNKRVTKVAAR